DLPEVGDDIAALREPLAELRRARADDDVGDGAGLLALADRPDWQRGVPHVPDDARADRLGKPRPHDEDLRRLVVRRLLARVAALRQLDDLPRPLEDRRLLDVDLALDLAADGRALVDALHVQGRAAVALLDLEVVLRAAPVLCFPFRRHAGRSRTDGLPVLDHHLIVFFFFGCGQQDDGETNGARAHHAS